MTCPLYPFHSHEDQLRQNTQSIRPCSPPPPAGSDFTSGCPFSSSSSSSPTQPTPYPPSNIAWPSSLTTSHFLSTCDCNGFKSRLTEMMTNAIRPLPQICLRISSPQLRIHSAATIKIRPETSPSTICTNTRSNPLASERERMSRRSGGFCSNRMRNSGARTSGTGAQRGVR